MIPVTARAKRKGPRGNPGSNTTDGRPSTTSRRKGEKETMQANQNATRGVPRQDAVRRRAFPRRVVAAYFGPVATFERELPRYLSWTLAAFLVASVALSVGAKEALAQAPPGGGGGGGDAIQQTLTNVRDYLAALSFSVGGIGFVASLLVKGYASINENAHAYAAMGMKGSLWCIVAGVIVTPILTIAAGLAGG